MLPKPNFLQNINSDNQNVNTNENNGAFNRNNFKSRVNYSSHGNNLRFHNNNRFDSRFGHKQPNNSNHRINNNNNDSIRCNHNGCTFTGTKDVVFMHKKIQHFELQNKYNVDFKLDTPDDIERWKAERRARFPTIENEQKKQLESNIKPNMNSNMNNNANKRKNNYREKRPRKFQHNNSNNKRNRFDNNSTIATKNGNQQETSVDKNNSTAINLQAVADQTTESNSNTLLSLFACYESEDDETIDTKVVTTNSSSTSLRDVDNMEQKDIVQLVDDLIVKLEDEGCRGDHNTVQLNKKESKKSSGKPKFKKSPPQTQLCRNKLSLFQKLMLQDVANAKADLVECLQILVDSNFMQI